MTCLSFQQENGDERERNIQDVTLACGMKGDAIDLYEGPAFRKDPVLMAAFEQKLIEHVDNRIMIDRKNLPKGHLKKQMK